MALDAEDLKKVQELIAGALTPEALTKAIAPAVEAHVKAATKDLPTAEGIGKSIAAEVAKLKPADDGKGDDDKGKGGKPDPQVAALTAKITELQKTQEATERARVDAERARKADANKSAVKDALAKAGVPAEKLHLALPVVLASGALELDGDAPGWKGKDPTYGVDKTLTFEEGAAAWVKTDDGKHFLPPVDAGGTGQGNPNKARTEGGNLSLKDLRGSFDVVSALSAAQGS